MRAVALPLTPKQTAVLAALDARPDYWITEASDLADAAGLTDRGTLTVLYHLSDAGIVEYTETGWKRRLS
jgi:DNA-binding MarR family transcriptional regulator